MTAQTPPTIVVATDFTPASRAAFERGVELAREAGGRLLLVHAVKPLGAPGLEPAQPATRPEGNETAEPAPAIGVTGTEWVDLARAQGVEADVVVRPGLAQVVIVEEAERVGAHTIVLGSQGKEGLAKVVLGSVAEEVRKATSRPVEVVEPQPDGTAAREAVGRRRPARPHHEEEHAARAEAGLPAPDGAGPRHD